jgi:hypothetical protein
MFTHSPLATGTVVEGMLSTGVVLPISGPELSATVNVPLQLADKPDTVPQVAFAFILL